MSDQSMNFIAKAAMAMPNLTRKQMQYWIDNPIKFKAALEVLQRIEPHFLHETVIEVRPMDDTLDPLELLLDPSRVKLEQDAREILSDCSWALVPFIDTVNYMITKRDATNANVRTDLPEHHLFKGDTVFKYTLIASLIQKHELYDGVIGLSPNTPNVLYFSYELGGMYIIEIKRLEGEVWEIRQHSYQGDMAHEDQFSWPAGTRIYFPSSK